MFIRASDITVVFQGPVLEGEPSTAELIRQTRGALPGCRIVLSTWTSANTAGIQADTVLQSEDPGGLPGIKHRDGPTETNNVNRQILSTRRGLQEVDTPYAVKLRTDCALRHAGLLERLERRRPRWLESRLVACSLFTVDPLMFEQMPYHVSDWLQFGDTDTLLTYWSAPFMTEQDATYYERRPYAPHSTFMDRRFRCRLAVEQYLATHYAGREGFPLPQYHNDVRPEVLAGHRRFLAERWYILDPWDVGLRFPKYEWAYRSGFQRLNCLLFQDWYRLYLDLGGAPLVDGVPPGELDRRRRRKEVARRLGRVADRAGPLLVQPRFKRMINRCLRLLERRDARDASNAEKSR